MKNEWYIVLLLFMTIAGSLGSVYFKNYTLKKKLIYLFIGFSFYGVGALLNIYLLKVLPYTIVLPANALTFIWTLLFAKWVFKEPIGMYKIAGVAFIISGLIVLIS